MFHYPKKGAKIHGTPSLTNVCCWTKQIAFRSQYTLSAILSSDFRRRCANPAQTLSILSKFRKYCCSFSIVVHFDAFNRRHDWTMCILIKFINLMDGILYALSWICIAFLFFLRCTRYHFDLVCIYQIANLINTTECEIHNTEFQNFRNLCNIQATDEVCFH